MRRRPLFWLIISVLCFIGAYYSWRLGDRQAAAERGLRTTGPQDHGTTGPATPSSQTNSGAASATQHAPRTTNAFPYRLSNTTKTLAQLDRSDHAILLENALLDTDRRAAGGATAMPAIPPQLRAQGDPGAYIVQSRGPLDDEFRALLNQAGATVVSYIPNNAYLVRASQSVADQLKSNPQTQSVLPYEPYYKLKSSLLNAAIENVPLPDNSSLNVLVFTDSRQATTASLAKLGVTVLGEERSPFGTVLKVKPSASSTLPTLPTPSTLLTSIASLTGVQEIELASYRVPANDLSRARVGVAPNSVTTSNYLGLTGVGVLVNVNDTGVEASHPDLTGRVFGDTPISILDFDGHGTHVAGTIMGSGLQSPSVTSTNLFGQGSFIPATNGQFRGMAPASTIFSTRLDLVIDGTLGSVSFNPLSSDAYIQETAAKTNALISNNSWNYFSDNQYDLPAASYDAAVRDALPLVSGSQPVLFVFAAGNAGRGDDSGLGGTSGSIQSPGTAKNVITVGYIELPRNITNQAVIPPSTNPAPIFQGQTDSDNQVAASSSRGNVGIGIEGPFGRFKPDVVAPGAFVISTRASTWSGGRTNHIFQYFREQVIPPGGSLINTIFLPVNTAQLVLRFLTNSVSQPGLNAIPIYVKQSGTPTPAVYDFTGTSPLTIANPSPLGVFWNYGVFNNTTTNLVFDFLVDAVLTNDPTISQALQTLNTNLAPYYRYESGSSMAAADVSGVLALMQEFFQSRYGLTNSPALMKALLINGARSLGQPYDFEVTNSINLQGWGLINLSNTLQGGLAAHSAPSNSVFFVDQSPTNSLATGQSHTYRVDLSLDGQLEPLRVTLVWTDPAGNPLASKKLVNDLDLVVTNLDDPTQVFVGNYILPGDVSSSVWDTNVVANLDDLKDSVNNVENIYLDPILGSAYSITVIGHRVNVNAVTAHTNDVVQDYALVVSSGDGDVTNVMAFSRLANAASTVPFVTGISNQFLDSTTDTGGVLINQRVGASSPLLGTNQIPYSPGGFGAITIGQTNQWHFFTITNVNGFTNAAFLTFDSVNLSLPRMGVRQGDLNNASRPDADVDLYVSTDPGLTNLDPAALNAAYKSLGRRGNETIILSNAVPGTYFAGVKAEDQMAAQFSFLGDFAKFPFGGTDGQGNQTLRGIGLPQAIPDGTPSHPGGITILAVGQPEFVRRVVVTNILTHELVGDLVATLHNQTNNITLINHSPDSSVVDKIYVYDDSGEGDIPGAQTSSGPGSLHDLAGKVVDPQWEFFMSDNAFTHVGTNGPFTIWLEKQSDLTQGILVCVQPGRCHEEFFVVPDNATAAIITASSTNATPLLTTMQVCELGPNGLCSSNVVIGTGASIILDQNSTPVLIPGRTYLVRLCNPNTTVECLFLKVAFESASEIIPTLTVATNALLTLPDDAVVYSGLFVSNHVLVRNLDVGLLINHARVSDLAITLISPNGTRIVLFENRGGFTTNGLGNIIAATNNLGVPGLAYTNMVSFYTNDFESSAVGLYAPGAIFQGWNVLTNFVSVLPDYSVPWQSNRLLVLGDGIVSNTLPVTNSTGYHLSFNITHAPYLVGTVGWWPFDHTIPPRLIGTNLIYSSDLDTPDIFGGHDALLSGDPTNGLGKVAAAYYGDGVATKAVVPRGWDLDLGEHTGRGFSIEGWIKPRFLEASTITNLPITEVARGTMSNHLYIVAAATNGITWTLAESKAVAMGGHLVSISSAAEQSFVYGLASSSPLVWAREGGNPSGAGIGPWLGGHRTGTVWAWSDGTPFTYTNWSPGEPNNYNGDEDRLEFVSEFGPLMSGLWNDYPDNAVGDGVHLGPNPHGFIVEIVITNSPAPLVEWNDPTNQSPQGVQFWIGGLPGSNNIPGSLWANIWDTNLMPHIVSLTPGPITNGGWQHVALTYDATNFVARIYTNGQLAVAKVVSITNFVPRTDGDLFFGFHPPGLQSDSCYPGGLDEFALYDRPISDCEVLAIYNAGGGGKYGTNVLSCPVGVEVTLQSLPGNPLPFTQTVSFTNIVSWTNPVPWFTNIDYTTGPQFSYTNGPITNLVAISLRPLDPNVAVDNFVLSALTTNFVSGLFHFNEDGSLALGEIKFGTTPYAISNSPPFLVFSNDFESVTQSVYQVGRILPGIKNDPAIGRRDWLVTSSTGTISNSITVVSNSFYGIAGSNWAALARGAVSCALPTVPGQRYKLTYSLHGPCSVGWWNGDVEPLSQRAQDLIGGNHGAFVSGASNFFPGFVGDHALYFNGEVELPPPFDPDIGGDRDDPGTQILMGDPANLRLTNAFTIEGWIQPNDYEDYLGTEQLFFRGDSRQCFDPYYLALEPAYSSLPNRILHFHVEDATGRGCGTDLLATDDLVFPFQWQHIAAVFEPGVIISDPPYVTNILKLYLRGILVASNYTDHAPFRDLNQAFSPQVAMGGVGTWLNTKPYRGIMDEMTVYARGLTPPEILAIARARTAGKADTTVAASRSLAKLRVLLDGTVMDTGYGNNSTWSTRDVVFTALRTNMVLTLESLLPGTLVDMVTLSVIPAELTYLPEEQSLSELNGEDAYGLWQLEIWDTRVGATNVSFATSNGLPQLVNWQLTFQLPPVVLPEPVYLSHGITYTNTLRGHGVQYFTVQVPQWATVATNVVFVTNTSVSVYFNQTNFPPPFTNPPVFSGTGSNGFVLLSNSVPPLVIGQPYYFAVTNLNPFPGQIAVTVFFDITPLTNCVATTNFVGPAGIPRYFQFDVPTNGAAGTLPQEVTFWLSGANSNVTVVLSQHLPLPDLTYHDYVSAAPGTNDEIVMVVTNTMPFPIQTNRWYVGVFNNNATNVPFTVQTCYITNYPTIIDLTNAVPYTVALPTDPFAAPPGPPRWVFYRFSITNLQANGVLFELYNLSGDADLLLQREVPPGMAPYFDTSFRQGVTPEQIVVRANSTFPDLRYDWYLGVYNNETNNVAYTIRAVVTDTNRLLVSAQPFNLTAAPLLPSTRGLLLSWHGVEGETYLIQFSPSLLPPVWSDLATVVATTPFPTYEVYPPSVGFYRIVQVANRFILRPTLTITLSSINCPPPAPPCVRISWPTSFTGFTLQSETSFLGPWVNVPQPVFIEGNEFVVYDTIGPVPKFYRLFQ